MSEQEWLAERFEGNRAHLRAVAYRMLGTLADADDAVQEAWLRLSRAGASGVENLSGWLTTIVARVCLDMLRARQSRREEPLGAPGAEVIASREAGIDPEAEALLAESVGLALLVVLDTLAPAERLAFVLHDMFAVPFDEIAPLVGRTPTAARQLASRARRRVQSRAPASGCPPGAGPAPDEVSAGWLGAAGASPADLAGQREVVDAFLAAAREGNFDALLAVLDPDVVHRADRVVAPPNGNVVRGARAVVKGALAYSRRAGSVQQPVLALVNGAVGVLVAPRGRLARVVTFKIRRGKIVEIEVLADPERLRQLDLALLSD